mgnify:FL=1
MPKPMAFPSSTDVRVTGLQQRAQQRGAAAVHAHHQDQGGVVMGRTPAAARRSSGD